MQAIRSKFFTSVAHELRTPLNSIIPILRMILDSILEINNIPAGIIKKLRIVYNSALHLQNVIDDFLDVTRVENGKFTLFKEFFDIRKAVKDVCEIMEF